jgi:hypothetical protein
MQALKNTTIVVSALSIVIITLIWLSTFIGSRELPNNFISTTLWIGAFELFYIAILWVHHHFRESKQIKVINWIAFILSMLPVLGFIVILKMMSGIEC